MLIFDLDGTLLDLWPKYHYVFCQLTQAEDISKDDYKRAKQILHKDQLVAEHFGYKLPPDYFQQKALLLEAEPVLMLDKLFFNVDTIVKWFVDSDTFILTKRRNRKNLAWQMNYFGLQIPIVSINDVSKAQWIYQCFPNHHCTIIGDSLEDLETGRLSNVDVYMVEYGLGTKEEFDSKMIKYHLLSTPEAMSEFLGEYNHAVS